MSKLLVKKCLNCGAVFDTYDDENKECFYCQLTKIELGLGGGRFKGFKPSDWFFDRPEYRKTHKWEFPTPTEEEISELLGLQCSNAV